MAKLYQDDDYEFPFRTLYKQPVIQIIRY